MSAVLTMALIGKFLSFSVLATCAMSLFATSAWADSLEEPAISPNDMHSESGCAQLISAGQLYNLNPTIEADKNRINAAAGKDIRAIHFYSLEPFNENNPKENNWVYRLLNKIHINTYDYVIRQELLFTAGEKIDLSLIRESERILRDRPYINNAIIVPETICADSVTLAVITRDNWSLQPTASASRTGGDTSTGRGISEDNVLGTGNALSVDFSSGPNGNKLATKFKIPHILGSRYQAELSNTQEDRGREQQLSLERPFYALDTRYAYGIKLKNVDLDETYYLNNIPETRVNQRSNSERLFVGYSQGLQGRFVNRWYLVANSQDSQYTVTDNMGAVSTYDVTMNYPSIAFERIENRFGVFKNINKIQRTEDIALGISLYLELGQGGSSFSNKRDFYKFNGRFSDVLSVGEHHLAELSTSVDGSWFEDANDWENTVVSSKVAYHHFRSEEVRWFGGLRYDVGLGLNDEANFTYKDEELLRGFPSRYQRGDRRIIGSLERRRYSDYHILNLVRVGSVVFIDFGKIWTAGKPAQEKLLSDIGFGLRIGSSKSSRGSLLHVDFAVPIVDRNNVKSVQISLKTYKNF